jgi:O-antigen ligase
MTGWISWSRAEDIVSLLSLSAIGLAVVVMPFFLGGNGLEGESILFILTGFVAYFSWKSDPSAFSRAITRPISIVFFLFLCAMVPSLVRSADQFSSLTSFLNWIALFIIFTSASVVVDSPRREGFLIGVAIASGVLLSLVGLNDFLHTTNFGYLRLTSTFGQHNAFGGFLLLPLALLIGRFFQSAGRVRVGYGLLLIVTGSAFILTFSRGSWASLLFGGLTSFLLFRKEAWELAKNRKVLVAGVSVALIIAGVVLTMVHLSAVRAAGEAQTIGVFTGETLKENALTARLHYFADALTIIKHNLVYGVGLRHYGEAVKLYKDTPAFYASSPHNEYLKVFAETGVFGGILFIVLLIGIVVGASRTLLVAGEGAWLIRAALVAGGVAVFAHLGIEVDWGYVGNQILFFALAGAVCHAPREGTRLSVYGVGRLLALVVILAGVCVSFAGALYWHQLYHTDRGSLFLNQGKFTEAFLELKEAQRFSDWNYSPHYFTALVLERSSRLAIDPEKKQSLLRAALVEMNHAIARKPEKPLFYSWQALIYQELGDDEGYQRALEMTVTYNPVEGIYEYDQLAALYNKKGAHDKVIALAEKVLPYYPLDMYANPYWVNPDKEVVWKQVADICLQASIAYAKTGDHARSKGELARMAQYRAVISK